jgi:transposase InsO family protein
MMHKDLCGPISLATLSDNRYFLLLVDDSSRFMWLQMLRSNDQVARTIKQFQQIVESEMRCKLKVLHSDHGGKFTSAEVTEHCVEHGVQRQLMEPNSLQQGNVIEHRNQTVVGMAHSLLKSKNLSGGLWGEAVVMQCTC